MGLSNVENILQSIVDSEEYDKQPQSRVEELLLEVKEAIEEGGGGGTTNYNALENKPQIAGTTLQGDKSLADLGIASDDAVENIYAVMGEMGAKNLIPYPWYETTKSANGVTFIDNVDGTVTVSTVSGGATANTAFTLHTRRSEEANDLVLPNGDYILSGCPSGGSDSTYSLRINITKNSRAVDIAKDYGEGTYVTLDGDDFSQIETNVGVFVFVASGTIITTPITFKPMLRLASDTDDTYQRYAKTNKQLTDEIANKVDKVEGKGLSTNDYDNTEKGKVADNTGAIEAIVNVNGACNVFAIDNPISLSDMEVSNNELINTNTDTLDYFDFMLKAYVNGSYGNIDPLAHEYIAADGNYSYTVLIPSNATKLQLKHNGAHHDLSIEIPMVPAGTYKLTFTVNGYNPSTVGGLEISNIMLYDARLNPSGYVPYAMTNRELTDAVNNIETLQTIYPSMLLTGSIRIKRNCGVKFVVADNLILTAELASGDFIELCTAGTVLNPPVVTTEFLLHAASGGVNIAPVNLIMYADGSIYVKNYSSSATLLYAHCCGAYI